MAPDLHTRTLLTTDQVAAKYGLNSATMRTWRSRGRGEGPPKRCWVRVGRKMYYDDDDPWFDRFKKSVGGASRLTVLRPDRAEASNALAQTADPPAENQRGL